MPSEAQRIVLYTRRDCHLCDDAKQILVQHQLTPVEVDIDEDDKLAKEFNHCVPVIEIDGKIRFRGRVDPILLKRILDR